MGKFNNPKKQSFLDSLPVSSIESSDIAEKCKFNFAYFDDSQIAGQGFTDWSKEEGSSSLVNLGNKLKDYTNHPLSYWRNQRAGGGGLKVLEYYNAFPKKSCFSFPKHVPHDVCWGRFRLGNRVRLIGFVIPNAFCDKRSESQKGAETFRFDVNTFYVVFLDKNHMFYHTEKS